MLELLIQSHKPNNHLQERHLSQMEIKEHRFSQQPKNYIDAQNIVDYNERMNPYKVKMIINYMRTLGED